MVEGGQALDTHIKPARRPGDERNADGLLPGAALSYVSVRTMHVTVVREEHHLGVFIEVHIPEDPHDPTDVKIKILYLRVVAGEISAGSIRDSGYVGYIWSEHDILGTVAFSNYGWRNMGVVWRLNR